MGKLFGGIWVCPYLSPECGENGLKNKGCHIYEKCHDEPKERREKDVNTK